MLLEINGAFQQLMNILGFVSCVSIGHRGKGNTR